MMNDGESTVMSILHGVAGGDAAKQRACLERFCVTYTQPLIDFLVRAKRIAEHDASDLVQDFWLAKMLAPPPESNLVAKFLIVRQSCPNSSFRGYLSKSLTNFLLSKYRSAGEATRRAQVSLEQLEGWEPESSDDLEQFDRTWANHLLTTVLERIRQECETSQLQRRWLVFTKLILRPYVSNEPRPSYAAVAQELSLKNPKEVGTALTTFKRSFLRHLHVAVQDYLPASSSEESVAATKTEVEAILLRLSKAGELVLPLEEWGITSCEVKTEYRLALDNLTAANLLQSVEDYRAAWEVLLKTSLSEVMDFRLADGEQVTIKDLTAGEVQSLKLFDQIRARAKHLGSAIAENDETVLVLNKKMYGLIYLIAIASAKVHGNYNISSQPVSQLASLTRTFSSEEWVDEESRALLDRFQATLVGDND